MTSEEIFEDLRLSFKRESKAFGTENALFSLLKVFDLFHPNFAGFLFRSSDPKKLILTTEGNIGIDEKQVIRVPENIFDFPLSYTVHLLFHEFIHIQQRARPDFSASRAVREFEAYYLGLYGHEKPEISLPKSLRLQFEKNLEKYFNQMNSEEKESIKQKYKTFQKSNS
jgi:hypothetical protein